ncbi:hypothetical protein [Rhizobium ruizarguesonis]|uniref:hypothetical protein n=1 Tax=Rhizobium ruizarguesonis TaxID=2081791 RepID=UPI0009499912|nr:hypothetical protein [Rhizobium ruizarguesonis]UED34246.1 hypothetical protein BSO17_24375 [Rhizobium ruizarguesonis]
MLKVPTFLAQCFAAVLMFAVPSLSQEAGAFRPDARSPVQWDEANEAVAQASQSAFAEALPFPSDAMTGGFEPAVPLMIPVKMFSDLKAGSSFGSEGALTSNNSQSDISFNGDGYTATVRYPDYTVLIEGSVQSFSRGGISRSEAKPDKIKINDMDATFTYAGVDYLLIVECKVGDAKCISEAEMNKLIDDFVLCNRQNQCVKTFPIKRD